MNQYKAIIEALHRALADAEATSTYLCIALIIVSAVALVMCALAWRVLNENDIKPSNHEKHYNPRNHFISDEYHSRHGNINS